MLLHGFSSVQHSNGVMYLTEKNLLKKGKNRLKKNIHRTYLSAYNSHNLTGGRPFIAEIFSEKPAKTFDSNKRDLCHFFPSA